MTFPWKATSTSFGASHAFMILVVSTAFNMASFYLFAFAFGFLDEVVRTVWPSTLEGVNLAGVIQQAPHVLRKITEGTVIVLMIRYFSRAMSMDLLSMMGWSSFRFKEVLWGFFGGGALGLLIFSFQLATSGINGPVSTNPDSSHTSIFFLGLFALATLFWAPLIEELLFRGVLYLGFSQSWGNPWAALGVIFLFSSVHLLNTENIGQRFLSTVLLGALLLFVRVKTDSLFPGMALHSAYNMFWVITIFYRHGILPS